MCVCMCVGHTLAEDIALFLLLSFFLLIRKRRLFLFHSEYMSAELAVRHLLVFLLRPLKQSKTKKKVLSFFFPREALFGFVDISSIAAALWHLCSTQSRVVFYEKSKKKLWNSSPSPLHGASLAVSMLGHWNPQSALPKRPADPLNSLFQRAGPLAGSPASPFRAASLLA